MSSETRISVVLLIIGTTGIVAHFVANSYWGAALIGVLGGLLALKFLRASDPEHRKVDRWHS